MFHFRSNNHILNQLYDYTIRGGHCIQLVKASLYHVMSCHVMSYHISRHVTSHHITSHQIRDWRISKENGV